MFSFTRQKTQGEVRDLLRRLTDVTTPNLPPVEGDSRMDRRYNRTLPVLLAPWKKKAPCVEQATMALTKDVSDCGMALVLHQPFSAESIVIALLMDESHAQQSSPQVFYALGQVRQDSPLGGGYRQLGIELTERTDPTRHRKLSQLEPLVKCLTPESFMETVS